MNKKGVCSKLWPTLPCCLLCFLKFILKERFILFGRFILTKRGGREVRQQNTLATYIFHIREECVRYCEWQSILFYLFLKTKSLRLLLLCTEDRNGIKMIKIIKKTAGSVETNNAETHKKAIRLCCNPMPGSECNKCKLKTHHTVTSPFHHLFSSMRQTQACTVICHHTAKPYHAANIWKARTKPG